MKTPFHTPLKLEVSNGASTFYLRDERGDYIAKTSGGADKNAANASEIALRWNSNADLLAALEGLLSLHDPDGKFEPACNKPLIAAARAAIAKATGGAA